MKSAAVIGAGLMGTGIAKHLAEAGLDVTLVDENPAQLAGAIQTLGSLTVSSSTDLRDIAAVDFAIEAVFEDLQVKQAVLSNIANTVSRNCIIASNTSSLLIRDLAETVNEPARFLGVHYNNPADMNPIVEIVPTEATTDSITNDVQQWMTDNGKRAVRCADTYCFVLNRQSLPYINEAARCLAIATPGEVDRIATEKLGAGLGPFAVMNLVGLPVMAAASKNLAILGNGYQVASTLQARAAEGAPWEIERTTEVSREMTSELIKRLRGAMLFPGKDILDQSLCSKEDLHAICIEALGYEKSSPELLDVLKPHIVNQLISDYLRQF